MDNLEYIRRAYSVPAYVGTNVLWNGYPGQIVGNSGPHLLVKIDRSNHPLIIHPTDVIYGRLTNPDE